MFKPNRQFQAGLDQKEARRQREKNSLSLRRKEREMKLANKRKKILKQIQRPTGTLTGNKYDNELNEKIQRDKMLAKLPRFVQGVFTEHATTMFECTQEIRKLLAFSSGAPIREVIDSGVVPRLIQFLRRDDYAKLQFEAMWILTNIASSDNPKDISYIVNKGAIAPFIEILSSPNYSLKDQSIWALGNLAGDCEEIRNLLINNNILPALLNLCKLQLNPKYNLARYGESQGVIVSGKDQFISLLSNVAWAVSNFCRCKLPEKENVKSVLECLYYLLRQKICMEMDDTGDGSYSQNIGWSFVYLLNDIDETQEDIEIIEIMNETGITKDLMNLLSINNAPTKHSVLRSIGSILTGNDKYTTKCIEYGLLGKLYELFQYYSSQSNNHMQLKELCWAISNITAGTQQQVKSVIKGNIFPILINILQSSRVVIATEALWAISNATSHKDYDVIYYLVQQKVIKALCIFFKRRFNVDSYNKTFNKVLLVSLECIENILYLDDNKNTFALEFETNGGCDFVEELQSIDKISQQVYDKACEIVQFLNGKYTEEQGEFNDNTFHNEIQNGQFTFGSNNNNQNTNVTFQF